jgi:hypothetical protein
MEQRLLSEDEVHQARALTNWTFWLGPAFGTAVYAVIAWYFRTEEPLFQITMAVLLGGNAVVFWLIRIRQHANLTQDLNSGLVHVLDGAPEKARVSRGGFCYVWLQGLRIRVPNDEYQGIRDANLVRIAFLPKSRLAVRVDVMPGVGLTGSNT